MEGVAEPQARSCLGVPPKETEENTNGGGKRDSSDRKGFD